MDALTVDLTLVGGLEGGGDPVNVAKPVPGVTDSRGSITAART